MKIKIFENKEEVGQATGEIILETIKKNKKSVLGLATGSSPESTYEYIIAKSKKDNIDWSEVITFNLDEYEGLSETNDQSYRYYMNKNLFNHININIKNTFVPSGFVKTNEEASKYDEQISNFGGIDLQLLGIGTNGHIGFNEPGTSFESITSIVDLAPSTIESNSRFFASENDVPKRAISMGLKSIMNVKKIVLIAIGSEKAQAIKQLVEGEISTQWPCSILKTHPDLTLILDKNAAKLLS